MWKLDFVTPKGLKMDDAFYCESKDFMKVP